MASLRPWLALGLVLTVCTDIGTGSKKEETVEIWARKLGDELWQLGSHVTKFDSIISSYSTLNAQVLPTDGEAILSSIVDNVSKLMKQKMNAVMCIIEAAEAISEDAEINVTLPVRYHSSKCSDFIDEESGNISNSDLDQCKLSVPGEELEESRDKRPQDFYLNLTVTPDRHFYRIPVNTNLSAVHMPTDIYDYWNRVQDGIKWSKNLDEVFIKNYQSDPSLKWQYFGHNTGFMRMYPAFQWKEKSEFYDYDCRKSAWFIEATTCSKDIVILLDRSGSMLGMSNSIAKYTISQILSTLSNNDFVNIIGFNQTTLSYMEPCFSTGSLVPATAENVERLLKGVNNSAIKGESDFKKAFTAAFTLLKTEREERSCPANSCNQAVMLITDSVSGNITDIFEQFNWFENKTLIPVRVFTYLIGREVTKVREIQWMACLNRGYYVHIEDHSQVREDVLKYIPVMSRPLVLQRKDHPISWTHAFVDFKDPKVEGWLREAMEFDEQKTRLNNILATEKKSFSQSRRDSLYMLRFTKGPEDGGLETVYCKEDEKVYENPEYNIPPKYQEYHMMTSVSGPAFDNKINRGNETNEAQLLGVAGTDVPIKDIEKLTLPYKIGANGYAFIVTNNGYLMVHPDYRPVNEGKLRVNYQSVDLTEVELVDDDETRPREPHPKILELREAMINHSGESQVVKISNMTMKFHYDDKKRVGTEVRNYYFAGIPGTPFTVGLALPESYGNYWIKAGNIIKRLLLEGVPLTNFFTGNWKVHPDWVYCDHFIERADMTQEEKLIYFLEKIKNEKKLDILKSKVRFPPEHFPQENNETYGCNRNQVNEEDYFCDMELMQLLIFDAKSTESSYKDAAWTADNIIEEDLVDKYGVSVRFVATQGGLTRWQHITELGEDEVEFGETNQRTVSEPWYRSAVLQHYINDEDFVFSVPFKQEDPAGYAKNLTVTASYAIFRRDGGKKAPGSVVGFHFSYDALYRRFKEVTSKTNCKDSSGCLEPCGKENGTDCYIIDGNGYIVVSEKKELTGTFFGYTEGPIMKDMTEKKVFRKIPMFDYQAICVEEPSDFNSASSLWSPIKYLQWLTQWVITTITCIFLEVNWKEVWAHDSEEYTDIDQIEVLTTTLPTVDKRTVSGIRRCRSCDKIGYLYVLQSMDKQAKFTEKNDIKPYVVRRIPHTNLLLVVVSPYCTKERGCRTGVTESEFKEHDYQYEKVAGGEKTPLCVKQYLGKLPRRRLSGCYNQHPKELDIERCGRGASLSTNPLLLVPSFWLLRR